MLGTVHMSAGRDNKRTMNQIIVIYLKIFYYVYEKPRRFAFLQAESRLFTAASQPEQNNNFHINTSFRDENILSGLNFSLYF